MNKNRFAKAVAVAAGFVFLSTAPGLASEHSALPITVQTPKSPRPGVQPKKDDTLQNDFAGLNYTAEQKAKLDQIHHDTEMHKAAVVNDQKLNEDQKNAMLVGYTRMEYSESFKVLSPEQQKQVRQRLLARKAADQAAQKRQQPGRN
jgi:Spy/CpxP family protein refolding chaperone